MNKPTWKQKLEGFKALGKRLDLSNDGCSSSPDLNFRECCEEHDFYFRNDIRVTGVGFWKANCILRRCIGRKWGVPIKLGKWKFRFSVIPWVYWIGVTSVGWIPWNKNQKKIDRGEIKQYNTTKPKHLKDDIEDEMKKWYI